MFCCSKGMTLVWEYRLLFTKCIRFSYPRLKSDLQKRIHSFPTVKFSVRKTLERKLINQQYDLFSILKVFLFREDTVQPIWVFFICFLYFLENLLGIESNHSSRIRMVLHLVEAILMYCQVSKSHSFTVYVSDMSTPT